MLENIVTHPLELRRIVNKAISEVESLRARSKSTSLQELFNIPEVPTIVWKEASEDERATYQSKQRIIFTMTHNARQVLSNEYITWLYQMRAHLRGKLHTPRRKIVWYKLPENLRKAALENGGRLGVEFTPEMQLNDIPAAMWEKVILQYGDPVALAS